MSFYAMKAVTQCPHAGRGAGAKYSVICISYFPSSPLTRTSCCGRRRRCRQTGGARRGR